MTWGLDQPPPAPRPVAFGLAFGIARAAALAVLLSLGMAALLVARGAERVTVGAARPASARVVQAVCRAGLAIMGIGLRQQGRALDGQGAIVANHSSWLDILVLNASAPIFFVSKSEVAQWPGIGTLARSAGTVFIDRDRKQAARQTALFKQRLRAGHRLLFFPEGTSSDGARVLPFKPTLFEAFFADDLRASLRVQPVSVIYSAPKGQDARFYGWWGAMGFAPHFWQVLSQPRQGHVTLVFHPPLTVSESAGRKDMAQQAEGLVRSGHDRLWHGA